MIDIVIDTCVLVHANNPGSGYQEASIELIERLLNKSTKIVVDEDFNLENPSSSYIAKEYSEHLNNTMLGFYFLAHIGRSGRLKFTSKKTNYAFIKFIVQNVSNKKDHLFLKITYNSTEKILASHDYQDYHKSKRILFKREHKIYILDAKDVNKRL